MPTSPTKPAPSPSRFTQRLKSQGFDQSYYNRETGYHRVRCSQCEALCINGVPCHETGCPHQRHSKDD